MFLFWIKSQYGHFVEDIKTDFFLPSVNEPRDAAEYFEKILRLTSPTASEVKTNIEENLHVGWNIFSFVNQSL